VAAGPAGAKQSLDILASLSAGRRPCALAVIPRVDRRGQEPAIGERPQQGELIFLLRAGAMQDGNGGPRSLRISELEGNAGDPFAGFEANEVLGSVAVRIEAEGGPRIAGTRARSITFKNAARRLAASLAWAAGLSGENHSTADEQHCDGDSAVEGHHRNSCYCRCFKNALEKKRSLLPIAAVLAAAAVTAAWYFSRRPAPPLLLNPLAPPPGANAQSVPEELSKSLRTRCEVRRSTHSTASATLRPIELEAAYATVNDLQQRIEGLKFETASLAEPVKPTPRREACGNPAQVARSASGCSRFKEI
jgi:hypothetical protein